MTKLQTIAWTWKLAAPLGSFWRIHQLIRSLLIPYQKLLNYLPPTGMLFDLGCGHGIFLALAKISNPNLVVAGFDLAQNKIDGARLIFNQSGLKALNLDVSDINNFPNNSTDLITIIDALYLVPSNRWISIFEKCRKCLKQDGRLLIKEMDNSKKWKFFLLYLSELLSVKTFGLTKNDSSSFTFPTSKEIRGYLKEAGFNRIEEIALDRGYYIPHKLWIGQ